MNALSHLEALIWTILWIIICMEEGTGVFILPKISQKLVNYLEIIFYYFYNKYTYKRIKNKLLIITNILLIKYHKFIIILKMFIFIT